MAFLFPRLDRSRLRRAGSWLVVAAAVAGVAGCGGGFREGVFYKGPNRYSLGEPPKGFARLDLRGNDLAYVSADSAHSIGVNSTCEDYEEAPLEVLTNHLLMGFTERVKISQETGRMDGRESLHTHVRARMDGVPVELYLVVVKKNGCIYDFMYQSPPERFAEHFGTFRAFVDPFHTEPLR